jgi:uncharacterized membrane protein
MLKRMREWGDQEIEEIIGNLLRIGVLLSAAVVAVGGVLYLIKYGASRPHYGLFRGEPQDLRSVPRIVQDALDGHSRGIIQLGLLLLIATPIARVIFSIYAFAREKDRMYVVVTLIVLAVLIYSLVWGKV